MPVPLLKFLGAVSTTAIDAPEPLFLLLLGAALIAASVALGARRLRRGSETEAGPRDETS